MTDAGQRHLEEVTGIIEEFAKRELDRVQTVAVDVKEANDHDGDPILRVTVVYEGDYKRLDPSKLLGFVRHLRPALSERGEERFPVMSYISREDYAATA